MNDVKDIESRVCVLNSRGAVRELMAELADPYCLTFQGSHRRPDEFVAFRRSLRRVIKQWQPDIVHSHLWPACRWVSSALIDSSVQQVWQIHDTRKWLVQRDVKSRILRAWTRALLRLKKPDLVSVSGGAADYTAIQLGFEASSCTVISCGVDPRRYHPGNSGHNEVPVIGLAAQFRPEKGHRELLYALRALKDKAVRFEVRLAGSGPEMEEIRQLGRELGVAEHISFLGHVDDVPGFLRQLDLFVLPSTGGEGLPICLLEAMSARVPVVATSVGGTAEIVRNGETGYLVRPGDVHELTSGIERAIRERSANAAILDRARQMVLHDHTHDAVVGKLCEVYRRLGL